MARAERILESLLALQADTEAKRQQYQPRADREMGQLRRVLLSSYSKRPS